MNQNLEDQVSRCNWWEQDIRQPYSTSPLISLVPNCKGEAGTLCT
jgi:hypothetical protein